MGQKQATNDLKIIIPFYCFFFHLTFLTSILIADIDNKNTMHRNFPSKNYNLLSYPECGRSGHKITNLIFTMHAVNVLT